MTSLALWGLRAACAVILGACVGARAQQPAVPASGVPASGVPAAGVPAAGVPLTNAAGSSSISGVVKDVTGVVVSGAHIVLTYDTAPSVRDTDTDDGGRFTFSSVPGGSFKLTVSEENLQTQVVPGTLHAGEVLQEPDVVLRIATANTDVSVTMTQHELAEVDVKLEEKQNIFGIIPNYFVVYNWNGLPLDARQKFELANRTIIAPINIPLNGINAGIEQALNTFPGYGQGAAGYFKRYGATYADFAIGTELGGAILPVLFKEDPRYFYKGTGSIVSRALYAASTSVVGRTDKGKRRISYSSILGDFGAGAISNLYYPASSRQGATLTIENGLLGLGFDSVGNIIQEFLLRRLTPKLPPPESK